MCHLYRLHLGGPLSPGCFSTFADVCCAVQLRESVTPAQVVLGAGSTDGRERGVTMDVELDFSLAEPAIG